jgi:tetratricopeptide (TPR) repeat protein
MMAGSFRYYLSNLREYAMRFYPAAMALSLLVAVSASVSRAEPEAADPRAVALIEQGRSLLQSGDTQAAVDAFEAALAIDPGHSAIYLDLADASRKIGLQGKAIHYYREAQVKEPGNYAAIAGEGEALVEKGAVEKARRNLAKLESLCGEGCLETQQLASAIAAKSGPAVLTAEAIVPEPVVTQN